MNGSNFESGSFVSWHNTGNPDFIGGVPTFVSASQLTLQISAPDIAIPGPVQVEVLNPNFAALSNTVAFVINPGPAGGAQVISTGANGTPPTGNSHDAVLSFHGRFVAFASDATNLIAPSTKFPQGYVRDTCIGTDVCTPSTLLVSAVTGGIASSPTEGNGQGGTTTSIGFPAFSVNLLGVPSEGRFIGFLSTATNLVTPNTTSEQAYVRDTCLGAAALCTPATVLASVTQSGGEPNGAASEFMLTNNTCVAAFVSAGTDLVSGVTIPNEVYVTPCLSVGLWNTALVSASNSAGAPGDQGGRQPAISSYGSFVAFASTSTNLTSTPNGGVQQIYLRYTCLAAGSGCNPSTTMVSVDSSGNALAGGSQHPAISDDGRFVVFSTQVSLPAGGTTSNVFIRDTCPSSSGSVPSCIPSTTPISVAAGGGASNGPSSSSRYAVSGDGRFVVFDSSATNLVTPATAGNQVFIRNTCNASGGSVSGCTPSTVLLSVNNMGPISGSNAAISEDGHFAAFQTTIGGVQQVLLAATGF
jgi:hypothetical protein